MGVAVVSLLTGVVLCGVLLAIVLPNFMSMGYRAKRAEVPSNVDGIKTAELGYEAAFDQLIEVKDYVPDANVGKAQRIWPARTGFDTLGWAPDGQVRGAYRVLTIGSPTDADGHDFRVMGIIDTDADNEQATYTATRDINTVMLTDDVW